MSVASDIRPSPEARQLYSKMVARSDDDQVLNLGEAVALGAERKRQGKDPEATDEVHDLIVNEWIRPDAEGGWRLD